MNWLVIIPDLICVAVCLAAAVIDMRTYRIPNRLTLGAASAGLIVNAALALGCCGPRTMLSALLGSVAGGLLLLLVFGLLAAINFVGMGDVKLAAAVGTLVRWPLALSAMLYIALAGGVIGIGMALVRGELGLVLRNLVRIGSGKLRSGEGEGRPLRLHRMPYATAILLGSLWAIGARYWPPLRLL